MRHAESARLPAVADDTVYDDVIALQGESVAWRFNVNEGFDIDFNVSFKACVVQHAASASGQSRQVVHQQQDSTLSDSSSSKHSKASTSTHTSPQVGRGA